MTNEEAIKILKQYLDMDSDVKSEYLEAQRMAIKVLEQQSCEDYLKKRDKDYVHYNVKWLLDNWEQELEILSEGKIKPCGDCISREDVKEQMLKYGFNAPDMTVTEFVEDLPSIVPRAESEDKE